MASFSAPDFELFSELYRSPLTPTIEILYTKLKNLFGSEGINKSESLMVEKDGLRLEVQSFSPLNRASLINGEKYDWKKLVIGITSDGDDILVDLEGSESLFIDIAGKNDVVEIKVTINALIDALESL